MSRLSGDQTGDELSLRCVEGQARRHCRGRAQSPRYRRPAPRGDAPRSACQIGGRSLILMVRFRPDRLKQLSLPVDPRHHGDRHWDRTRCHAKVPASGIERRRYREPHGFHVLRDGQRLAGHRERSQVEPASTAHLTNERRFHLITRGKISASVCPEGISGFVSPVSGDPHAARGVGRCRLGVERHVMAVGQEGQEQLCAIRPASATPGPRRAAGRRHASKGSRLRSVVEHNPPSIPEPPRPDVVAPLRLHGGAGSRRFHTNLHQLLRVEYATKAAVRRPERIRPHRRSQAAAAP